MAYIHPDKTFNVNRIFLKKKARKKMQAQKMQQHAPVQPANLVQALATHIYAARKASGR